MSAGRDDVVDVLDGLQHALAEKAFLVAIAQARELRVRRWMRRMARLRALEHRLPECSPLQPSDSLGNPGPLCLDVLNSHISHQNHARRRPVRLRKIQGQRK